MFRERRGRGSSSGRRRPAWLSGVDALEPRRLMATLVDLATTQSANLGTELIGPSSNANAGYTVTDVGNVTGGGYDSYVVSVQSTNTGSTESAVYLVFGTKPTTSGAATGVASLTAALRGGDLATLGATGGNQVNPTVTQGTTPTPGFQFDGLKFVTGIDATTGAGRQSQLGASVTPLGDINGDGFADFMVGAPSDTGGGREFLIYGGSQLTSQTNKTIDLEPTAGVVTTAAPTKVLSFYNSTGATVPNQVGASAAGVRNFFANSGQGLNNATDLAIGDPLAVNAAGVRTGSVYVLAGTRVNALAAGTSVDLATVGTTGGIGVTFQGVNQDDQTGYSLAASGALDLTAATTAGGPNLLIGAPGTVGGSGNAAGRAYLIASAQATSSLFTLGTTQSLGTVGQVPTTTPTAIPTLTGDLYQGTQGGGQLGYAVSSATDLNADGVADIALGAPGNGSINTTVAQGTVAIVYDPETTFTTQATVANQYALTPGATSTLAIPTAYYRGTSSDLQAGSSLAPVYLASNFSGSSRGLLVGSPGSNVLSGAAYYIPAATTNTTITPATPVLTDLNTGSLFAFVLSSSSTNAAAPALASFPALGTSVSGRPLFSADTNSTTGDFFLGAPGFSLSDPATLGSGTILRNSSGAEFTVSAAALPGNSAGGGTTPVTPGGGTGTGSAAVVNVPLSSTYIQASPIFTGINAGQPYPTLTSLSHLDSYKPLPVQLAYQQFRPAQGFAAREAVYHNGGKGKAHQAPAGTILGVPQLGRRGMDKYNKVNTLPHGVFTRSKFQVGKATTFTHKVKVIPRNEQTQTFPG